MNERTRKIIVFAVFVMAIIWGYFNIFGDKDKSRSTADRQPAQTTHAPNDNAATAPAPGVTIVVFDSLEKSAWGRNPFYIGAPRVVNPHPIQRKIALKVQGILYREVGAQAFVNGRIVRVGDLIEDYHVVAINKDFIVVRHNDREYRIPVTKESS